LAKQREDNTDTPLEYRKASGAMLVIAAIFAIVAVWYVVHAAVSLVSEPTDRFHTRLSAVFAACTAAFCASCFVFASKVRTGRWLRGAWVFAAGATACCFGAVPLVAVVGASAGPAVLMVAAGILLVRAFLLSLPDAHAYLMKEIRQSKIVRSEGWMKDCDICQKPLTEDDPDRSPYCEGCFHLLRWARAHYTHAVSDVEEITPDTTYSDLSADSLEHIELVLEAEEKFNIEFSEMTHGWGIDPFPNIREFLRYLRSHGAVWPADHDIKPVTGRCIIWKYVKGWKVVDRNDPQHEDNTEQPAPADAARSGR